MKKNNKGIWFFLGLIVILLFFYFFYFLDLDFIRFKKGENNEIAKSFQDLVVVYSDKNFFPNILNIKGGVQFDLVLRTIDEPCDLVIDELNIKVPEAKLGKDSRLTVFFSEKETYEFYCSKENYKEMGVKGILNVN